MGLFKRQIEANHGDGRDALFRRPWPQRPRRCHFLLNACRVRKASHRAGEEKTWRRLLCEDWGYWSLWSFRRWQQPSPVLLLLKADAFPQRNFRQPTWLLLGSYFTYWSYKCYNPHFLDHMVRIKYKCFFISFFKKFNFSCNKKNILG